MTTLITPELVTLDTNLGSEPVGRHPPPGGLIAGTGRATGIDALCADALAREQKTATGVPGGIAIPHCRSAAVAEPTLAMARLAPAVRLRRQGRPRGPGLLHRRPGRRGPGAPEAAVQAGPLADQEGLHRRPARGRDAGGHRRPGRRRAGGQASGIHRNDDGGPGRCRRSRRCGRGTCGGSGPRGRDPGRQRRNGPRRLVAVTACPTGIAHTYMAADSLVAAAKEAGVDLQVETQGSGAVTPLDPAVIAAADAVIFAVDVDVRGKERFAGKPVINAPVKRGIDEPAKMVQEALAAATDPHAHRVPHFGAEEAAEQAVRGRASEHIGHEAEEGAAHRRQLHDPVRRRRRSADRPRLPARRLRHRTGHQGGRHPGPQHTVQPALTAATWPCSSECVLFKIGCALAGLPGPGTGGLHRLRHRGPARHRPRLRGRRRGRLHGRRLPRRPGRRPAGRLRRPLDRHLVTCRAGCAASCRW